MQATLSGLAATKNPKAVEILLAQAQPGVPERIRLSALAGLESLKEVVTPSQVAETDGNAASRVARPFLLHTGGRRRTGRSLLSVSVRSGHSNRGAKGAHGHAA